MQNLFIADWELKDLRKILEKGVEALRTHFQRQNTWNVLSKKAEMIGKVLVPCTFRHRYAKALHAARISLSNIAASIGHTTGVHHQSYARFIPDGTAD